MLAQCNTSMFHTISTLTLRYTLRVASNMTSQCEVTNIATVIQHCCSAARQMNKEWTERVKESWRREGDHQSVRQHGSSHSLYGLSWSFVSHALILYRCIWPFSLFTDHRRVSAKDTRKKGVRQSSCRWQWLTLTQSPALLRVGP